MFNNDYYQYYDLNANLSNSLSNFTKKTKRNWTELLNTTQKTLNIINQIIPIIYQIKPIYNNAKTMFKVINVINEDQPKKSIEIKKEQISSQKKKESNDSSPTFFL